MSRPDPAPQGCHRTASLSHVRLRMVSLRRTTTLLLVLKLGFACTSQTSGSTTFGPSPLGPTPTSTPVGRPVIAPLAGTSWVLTMVEGRSWPDGRPEDPRVTLSFTEDKVSGFNGCNNFGGNWRMDGRKVVMTHLVQTLIGCGGEAAWVEQRVMRVLGASPIAGNGGVEELRLTALPEGVLSFARRGEN